MNEHDEVEQLRERCKELQIQLDELKEWIESLYNMLDAKAESENDPF